MNPDYLGKKVLILPGYEQFHFLKANTYGQIVEIGSSTYTVLGESIRGRPLKQLLVPYELEVVE